MSATDVARAYDHLWGRLGSFEDRRRRYLVKRVREDDRRKVKELENDQRFVRLLYHTMREAFLSFKVQAPALVALFLG